MNNVYESFREIDTHCYQWATRSKENTKEIISNLNGIDVTIILTRMVVTPLECVKVPNRMYVSPDRPEIISIFNEYLCQPSHWPNWDKRLWVFKNNPNVNSPVVQFALQFFSNVEEIRSQIEKEDHMETYHKYCTIS